jgi:hypothetical protein
MMLCFPKLARTQRPKPELEETGARSAPNNQVNQDTYKPVQVFVQSKRNLPHDGTALPDGPTTSGQKKDAKKDCKPAVDSSKRDTAPAHGKADKCEQADIDLRHDRRLQIDPTPRKWRKADSIGNGSFGTVHLGLNSDTGYRLPLPLAVWLHARNERRIECRRGNAR